MPRESNTYKLEYFNTGEYYSGESDFRRFVTLDHNLESYLGIVGNGVLSGWTIEEVSGLTIQILPGKGIINGYFMESPYIVKLRSALAPQDVEIEVLTKDGIPEPDPQDDQVKTVIPYQIILPNNSDIYIFANRPSSALAYPSLGDYPGLSTQEPDRRDYEDYDSFANALSAYLANLTIIQDYNWWDNSINHFTEVQFTTSSQLALTDTKLLLGKIITRSGSVFRIDTSGVVNLSTLDGPIRKAAKDLISGHHHGGSGQNDPPKIRLETDIRDTVIEGFNLQSKVATYKILNNFETSIALGHKHRYIIDPDENGFTYKQIGSGNWHYHDISTSLLSGPKGGGVIDNHAHVLDANANSSSITTSSQYIVYIDGTAVADETSTDVTVDSVNNRISFNGLIDYPLRTFSSTFNVTTADGSINESYNFKLRTDSVFRFMIEMSTDFNIGENNYSEKLTVDENPFLFPLEVGSGLVGVKPLQEQSQIAEFALEKSKDTFTFSPNAANNITIVLEEAAISPIVQIEILDNVEIQGKLKDTNIFYIHADKFLTGTFELARIPFISHVGRLDEEFLATQYALLSQDGATYKVSPSVTGTALGHYHSLNLDLNQTGFTNSVFVGNDVVFYANDIQGNSQFIAHRHSVTEGTILAAESPGLTAWQGSNSSSHTHDVAVALRGDPKIVYSILEDKNGHIYVGTSDGMQVIPNDMSYFVIINDYEVRTSGSDLWTVLQGATAQYEKDTGEDITFKTNVYGTQVTDAESVLVNNGDSVLLVGEIRQDRPRDEIMVQKTGSFEVPHFKYKTTKTTAQVLNSETILEITNANSNESNDLVIVERDFSNIPIWSMALGTVTDTDISELPIQGLYNITTTESDIYVVGGNIVVKNNNLYNDYYKNWSPLGISTSIGVAKQIYRDSNNDKWLATNNGLYVLRNYQLEGEFNFVTVPLVHFEINDVIEGETGAIYIATFDGILKTTDGGKTWTTVLDVADGFNHVTKDWTLDQSNTVSGHYHDFVIDTEGNGFLDESIGVATLHMHTITNFSVASTLGHTHSMISTLYAAAASRTIYRSIDNGTTWAVYGTLPNVEYGDLFAAYGSLFINQAEGVYRSVNGTTWSKVLDKKSYTFNWNYNITSFMVGTNNAIYETSNGASFGLTHTFDGSPLPILLENENRKHFGYAYSNDDQAFYFQDVFVPSETQKRTALIDFNIWNATNGEWDKDAPYDIFIDYRLILSTKSDIDRRNDKGFHFTVDPTNGILDFRLSSSLLEALEIYDNTVKVENTDGFNVGDRILIESSTDRIYNVVSSVGINELGLAKRVIKEILVPSTVYRISDVDGDTSIITRICDSPLLNIGSLTHEDIEDGLSNYSDGRPFQLNDTYLSNLLQLTQAIRYVYPDIDEKFINSAFYDFHWSDNDPSSVYPDISGFIDVLTSDIYSQRVYSSNFSGKEAKSINRILIGSGSFSNLIFVATDAGLFWSKFSDSLEANWFYVRALQTIVYDIIIFGVDTILVATANGVFVSSDMVTWTKQIGSAINFSAIRMAFRWPEEDIITIPSHSATFVSNTISNTGTITALGGPTPYGPLKNNRGIEITVGGGGADGLYLIQNANSTSDIVVAPAFPTDNSYSDVQITMGAWWQQFDRELNEANINLKNTLIVGGENHIAFNLDDDNFTWTESQVDAAVSNFIVRDFYALSSGRMLGAVSGFSKNKQNYLISSTDIGSVWNEYETFIPVSGTISSVSLNAFNHTLLKVSYTSPTNYIYADGKLAQNFISIFGTDLTSPIFNGKVIEHRNTDNIDYLVVFGNELHTLISEGSFTFTVDPIKINSILESNSSSVFFGTNEGVYFDNDTVINNFRVEGSVTRVGINGTVTSVDIAGTIKRTGINSQGNTTFDIFSNTNVRGGSLIGRKLYITDFNPIESYNIVANSSINLSNEFTLELSNVASSSLYTNKRVIIVGDKSRLNVVFDTFVPEGSLSGSIIYISTNENNNIGKTYEVENNGIGTIDLAIQIVPKSTTASVDTSGNKDIIAGQSFRIADSATNLTLWTTFNNKRIKENEFVGFNFIIRTIDSPMINVSMPIISNTENNVVVDFSEVTLEGAGENTSLTPILQINESDIFEVEGFMFNQVESFNNKVSSRELDHYHDLDLINGYIDGSIGSFGATDASFVVINVSDTTNFSLPLVQLQGNLLEGAKIVFYPLDKRNKRYESQVFSHTSTTITVRTKTTTIWDFVTASNSKISVGWKWEINAFKYGYTTGITYKDFSVISQRIVGNLSRNSIEVEVGSTIGMVVGDIVRISDDTFSSQRTSIASIVDGTNITISDAAKRTYNKSRNPLIEVLRNTFSNIHTHQIRNGMVQTLTVSDYSDLGYPAQHSHRSIAFIEDVSSLVKKNNTIIAAGSSNKLYSSVDNGTTWTEYANLNNFLEGSNSIDGVSVMIRDGSLYAGATTGNIFVEGAFDIGNIIPLDHPSI